MIPVAVVAERLGVSADHVRRLIALRQLRAVNVSTGARPRYRIDEADLQRFIEARRARASDGPPRRTVRRREASAEAMAFFQQVLRKGAKA